MSEIEIGGQRYRVNKMNVFDQAHVARKVAPIIFSMGKGYASALAKLPARPETNGHDEDDYQPPDTQEVAEQNEVLFETLGPIVTLAPGEKAEHVERWAFHRGVGPIGNGSGDEARITANVAGLLDE